MACRPTGLKPNYRKNGALTLERKHHESLGEEGREHVSFIRQGVEQMSGFIQGFLQLSRLGSHKQPMTAVDLNLVVAEISAQIRYALEHEQTHLQANNLPTVCADSAQMKQLFQNLIDNAVKFRKKDQILKININAEAVDERWLVTVSDNGNGVNPAERETSSRCSTAPAKPKISRVLASVWPCARASCNVTAAI